MNHLAVLPVSLMLVLAACGSPADPASTATPTPRDMHTAPTASPATSATPISTAPTPPSPHAMGSMEPDGDEVTVRISNFTFADARIEVGVGTTVTWVNEDATRHTVTSGADDMADGRFDSGRLEAGETFSHRFDEPGEYAYFCDIHPTMTAVVVVTP